jgi:hypothetical protein
MPNALLCAEAVAMMILGKDVSQEFPRSYLVTPSRFEKVLEDAGRGEEVKKRKL